MEKKNPPRSLFKLTISMLIFGTIGLFRRWIPLPFLYLLPSIIILGIYMLLITVPFEWIDRRKEKGRQ